MLGGIVARGEDNLAVDPSVLLSKLYFQLTIEQQTGKLVLLSTMVAWEHVVTETSRFLLSDSIAVCT